MREVVALLRQFGEHRDDFTAAALAFYTALALAPAAIALGSFAGLVLSPEALQSVLEGIAGQLPETMSSLEPLVNSLVSIVERSSATSFTFTTIIGVIVAVYATSRFVYVLRLGLDVVHGSAAEHQGFIARLRSAVVTLIVVIVATIALVVLNLLPRIIGSSGQEVVSTVQGWFIVDWVISLVIIYVLMRALYEFGPHQRMRFSWFSVGATFATVWMVGATLVVGYLVSYSQTLGAAIALLGIGIGFVFWMYVIFLGVLLGAELEDLAQKGLWDRLRG